MEGEQLEAKPVKPEVNSGNAKRRKRCRFRTKALRFSIKDEIERAISLPDSPIRHLFSVDTEGIVSANLDSVVSELGLCDERYRAVSMVALLKMSNIASKFRVVGTTRENLRIITNWNDVDPKDATVYIDNLPNGCNVSRAVRRASMFGTVVSIRPQYLNPAKGMKHGEMIPCISFASTGIPNGKVHIRSAFVQFVQPSCAAKFCRAYRRNMPGKKVHFSGKKKSWKWKRFRNRGNWDHPPSKVNRTGFARKRAYRKRKSSESDEPPRKKPKNEKNLPDNQQDAVGNLELIAVNEADGSAESGSELIRNDIKKLEGSVATDTSQNRKVRRHRGKRVRFKRRRRVIHLTRYFRYMQVLSMKEFEGFRKTYLDLKKQKMKELKRDLKEMKVPLDSSTVGSSGKRRKRRGRGKLMARATKLQERVQEGH